MHRASRTVEFAEASVPAAQYVRMSTEHQRYSADNQVAAIEIYAAARGYEVVQTYADLGKSGLTIAKRPALRQLLEDVETGRAAFRAVLVYDVSRWGRFQDPDEAAVYEHACKRRGIAVHYCAELFENDGSMVSSLLKSIKRVMAAEYSRELSVKVRAAHCRGVEQGYLASSRAPLGTRRMLVDRRGRHVRLLEAEERNMHGFRLTLVPGPANEIASVRKVFRLYGRMGWTINAIARLLIREGFTNPQGGTWSHGPVRRLLSNEVYIGNCVYGRTRASLIDPRRAVPESEWVRGENVFTPLVSRKLFEAAQARLMASKHLTSEEMLRRLAALLEKQGYLTGRSIDDEPGISISRTYVDRFGSLAEAFALVGYVNYDSAQKSSLVAATQKARSDVMRDAAAALEASGCRAEIWRGDHSITVDGKFTIAVRAGRPRGPPAYKHYWVFRELRRLKTPLTLFARLDEDLTRIDYCLATCGSYDRHLMLHLPNANTPRRGMEHFATLEGLYGRCLRLLELDMATEVAITSARDASAC